MMYPAARLTVPDLPELHLSVPPSPAGRYTEEALAVLRSAGLNVTGPRRRMLTLLEESRVPMDAAAIRQALVERGIGIDLASVYRNLAVLERHRLVHRLATGNAYFRCELSHARCHHHFICQKCGEVREFQCDGLPALHGALERRTGHRVLHHVVELVGVCDRCGRE